MGGAARLDLLAIISPLTTDNELNWPPCQVVFFRLVNNMLKVRNKNMPAVEYSVLSTTAVLFGIPCTPWSEVPEQSVTSYTSFRTNGRTTFWWDRLEKI